MTHHFAEMLRRLSQYWKLSEKNCWYKACFNDCSILLRKNKNMLKTSWCLLSFVSKEHYNAVIVSCEWKIHTHCTPGLGYLSRNMPAETDHWKRMLLIHVQILHVECWKLGVHTCYDTYIYNIHDVIHTLIQLFTYIFDILKRFFQHLWQKYSSKQLNKWTE